ncbi:Thiol:disulfide interchange protein [Indibacter alkaliphilus LW1]|uniref:Thiol:disulfide interchange protein n=1 Tax=Indibacter alkaliphilus (strain CCUG 57479 / KCTC 22604 / LW1) TaxID=1189612 RepID=S2DNW7_INDAL|nr:redoxin domain-containing protein [Indibacter alkaliphilus]EOZ93641.1 Thiol:disulfide interchange protein [Indibacter alkaliphilus LW1]
MKNIANILLLLFCMAVFACKQESKRSFDGKVKISGELENHQDGPVVLAYIDEDTPQQIAEIPVGSNGKFEYNLILDGPGFYLLNLMGNKEVKLALYDQDVHINYNFADDTSLKVEGSEDSQYLQQINALMSEYQGTINYLNNVYMEAMKERDQEKIKRVQQDAMQLEEDHANRVKELVRSMDGSFAALQSFAMINPKSDFEFLDETVTKLSEKYPDFKAVQNLAAQLEDMRILAVGQPAPEISLPNPDGEMINLSDLRGKYVLIDFWAAWCRPCREENPNVVRLYNEYKDQGFEVFGVSLDRTKDAWVKAIADDNLTWTHVSDLKYFNSEAASIYQINAIPATYMLDPEGKIIAKDLRGPSLENKLKEIFN